MEDLAVWKQRWDALETMIEALRNRFEAEEVKDLKHLDTLRTLLDGLQDFAKCQFAFFFDGFGNNTFIKLDPSDKYPADYTLRITVNQIAHDVDLIQRIGEQRTIMAGRQEAQRPLLETLDMADWLAAAALAPVLSAQAGPAPVVLTYFQKSMNVRIIPYARVVLIGIPTTCLVAKRDFLAIPHEVGHYLYWCHTMVEDGLPKSPYSSQLVKEFLDKKFDQAPLHEWQEEIFADIYGCIVGGPVMGLSSQCTENEQPADWFIQKDRAYPFAVIRPYIYIQVLAQMGMAKASQALSKRWEGILKNERAIEADQLESEINKQLKAQWIAALSKGQTRDPAVEEIASQFAPTFQLAAFQSFVEQVLKHVLTGLQPVITKRWSEDIADGGAVETLFAQFETNLQDPNWPPQAVQEAAQRNSWQDFLVGRGYTVGRTIKAKTSEAKTSEVKLPEDWADQALADNAHGGGEWIKFTSDKWEAVVDLAGWATDGPVGKPHGVL